MGTLGRMIYDIGSGFERLDRSFIVLAPAFKALTISRSSAMSRHRTLINIFDKTPIVDKDAIVAPSVFVIGDVQVGRGLSIWYGCILRDRSVVLYGCTVEDEAYVGVDTMLLDGVVVEKNAMVAIVALVRQNTRIPFSKAIGEERPTMVAP
ncbi:hypothetical protein VNO78_00396 [Psophocarpus tetragonolobus]|uniref:Uncharacterized protein n=1 Tax=Psophocarpus tetragonolobus TaxID=3891 RepID=A0AAN9XUY8_PSOTE